MGFKGIGLDMTRIFLLWFKCVLIGLFLFGLGAYLWVYSYLFWVSAYRYIPIWFGCMSVGIFPFGLVSAYRYIPIWFKCLRIGIFLFGLGVCVSVYSHLVWVPAYLYIPIWIKCLLIIIFLFCALINGLHNYLPFCVDVTGEH